jgi:hypothetical protein
MQLRRRPVHLTAFDVPFPCSHASCFKREVKVMAARVEMESFLVTEGGFSAGWPGCLRKGDQYRWLGGGLKRHGNRRIGRLAHLNLRPGTRMMGRVQWRAGRLWR